MKPRNWPHLVSLARFDPGLHLQAAVHSRTACSPHIPFGAPFSRFGRVFPRTGEVSAYVGDPSIVKFLKASHSSLNSEAHDPGYCDRGSFRLCSPIDSTLLGNGRVRFLSVAKLASLLDLCIFTCHYSQKLAISINPHHSRTRPLCVGGLRRSN